jgi:hypothetical protein
MASSAPAVMEEDGGVRIFRSFRTDMGSEVARQDHFELTNASEAEVQPWSMPNSTLSGSDL